jgi:cytochrome oxidase assembly protein ShyY1
VLKSLLQPRYAALSVLMVIVAAVCVSAGTWQIARYEQKAQDNATLRRNAHETTDPVAAVLPVFGAAAAKTRDQVEFRRIVATGTFDATAQSVVRQRQVGNDTGFLVLTPLRTTEGVTLLVVRGFVSDDAYAAANGKITAPPAAQVTINARAQASESAADRSGQLPAGQLDSINVSDQVRRTSGRFYNGYAELEGGQPGTDGLTAIPAPDLSNPAGGALEPQHLAYVIQWYLFAALALAAPFAMIKSDRKRAPSELGQPKTVDAPTAIEEKLADRYGRR